MVLKGIVWVLRVGFFYLARDSISSILSLTFLSTSWTRRDARAKGVSNAKFCRRRLGPKKKRWGGGSKKVFPVEYVGNFVV